MSFSAFQSGTLHDRDAGDRHRFTLGHDLAEPAANHRADRSHTADLSGPAARRVRYHRRPLCIAVRLRFRRPRGRVALVARPRARWRRHRHCLALSQRADPVLGRHVRAVIAWSMVPTIAGFIVVVAVSLVLKIWGGEGVAAGSGLSWLTWIFT